MPHYDLMLRVHHPEVRTPSTPVELREHGEPMMHIYDAYEGYWDFDTPGKMVEFY